MKQKLIAFFYEYRAPIAIALAISAYIVTIRITGLS